MNDDDIEVDLEGLNQIMKGWGLIEDEDKDEKLVPHTLIRKKKNKRATISNGEYTYDKVDDELDKEMDKEFAQKEEDWLDEDDRELERAQVRKQREALRAKYDEDLKKHDEKRDAELELEKAKLDALKRWGQKKVKQVEDEDEMDEDEISREIKDIVEKAKERNNDWSDESDWDTPWSHSKPKTKPKPEPKEYTVIVKDIELIETGLFDVGATYVAKEDLTDPTIVVVWDKFGKSGNYLRTRFYFVVEGG